MRFTKRKLITMIVTAIVAGISLLVSQYIPVKSDSASNSIEAHGDGAGATPRVAQNEDDVALDDIEASADSDVTALQSNATAQQTANGTAVATARTNVTSNTNAVVTHVVDGDTFDADFEAVGKVRIRMLGVNTPETVDPRKAVECFGKAASDFSKKTLAIGSRILLKEDPEADERDKYGRLLRNVILADGTDFNALLVQEGYAYAYLSFPLSPERKVQLKRLEKEAKEAKRGLWGAACE